MLTDFYQIAHSTTTVADANVSLSARIVINKDHPIFQGHFPFMPIVPGVCMIQIIKDVLESKANVTLFFTSAANIKFLSVINPNKNSELNVEILFMERETNFHVDARLFAGETNFFKMKGTFSSSIY